MRILLVEDEKKMASFIERGLKEERYIVDVAFDGERGLFLAEVKPYDLIILDIIMEPMFGDSFFLYLRSDEKTMRIPVLVVSVLSPDTLGRLKKIDHVDTIDKPMTLDFLQKPITKQQLLKEVDRMII